MKAAILAGALLLAASSANAEEYFVEFDIVGLFTTQNFTSLEIEVDLGGKYMTVNGAFITSAGLSSPATGTCFDSAGGGVYCNLQVDQLSATLSIGATLAGTVSMKDANGITTATSAVTLFNIYPAAP